MMGVDSRARWYDHLSDTRMVAHTLASLSCGVNVRRTGLGWIVKGAFRPGFSKSTRSARMQNGGDKSGGNSIHSCAVQRRIGEFLHPALLLGPSEPCKMQLSSIVPDVWCLFGRGGAGME